MIMQRDQDLAIIGNSNSPRRHKIEETGIKRGQVDIKKSLAESTILPPAKLE